MKMRMKRMMGLFLALVMSIGCLSLNPIASYAEDADPNTFNINERSVNITQGGNYTIEGTGQSTSNTISVTGNNIKATITLHNVNIDVSNRSWQAAFLAKNNDQSKVHLTIILKGTNSLKSGKFEAGLIWNNSDNNSKLEIKGDGSLYAAGGEYGAGIGGSYEQEGKNFTITGGNVKAAAGWGAADIGGGESGLGGNITITGGTVTVTRVGDGDGLIYRKITITGGSVKASNISATPTDGNGNNVYLAKLENQDGVNYVTVQDSGSANKKIFKRTGNHPDGDSTFYLYLTGQDHDLVTSKGMYKAKWDSSTNTFTISKTMGFSLHKMLPIMRVKKQPKLVYREGEPLDLSGLVVTLRDNNGFEQDITINELGRYFLTVKPENTKVLTSDDNGKRVVLSGKCHLLGLSWLQVVTFTTQTDPLIVNKVYKVTYTDGVNGQIFPDQVTSDILTGTKTPAFTGTPTREGYVFAGWSPKVASKVTADATYMATWKEDKNHNNKADEDEDKYTVTYADGVDGQEIFPDQVTSGILSGTDTPKFNGTPSREGYVFSGWKPKVANKVTANATYVAQWKKDHFTVTFKDGDKTQTVKVENGKAIDTDALTGESMPKNPTKTGYTFKEWNTKEDGKGEKFTGESVVNSDMTVYAIYAQSKSQSKSPASKPQPKLPSPKSQSGTLDPKTQPETKPAPKPKPAPTPKSIPKTPESKTPAPKPDPKPAHKPQPETKHDSKSIPKTQHEPKPAPKLKPKQKFKAPAPKSKTKQQPKTQSETQAHKPQPETQAPKSQSEKRIGMIPKKGESALFAGLIAVLGFSIAGLAFFVRRK